MKLARKSTPCSENITLFVLFDFQPGKRKIEEENTMKMRLFDSPALNSRIKSANTQGSERWWGFFFGPMGAAILNVTIISYINVFYTDVLDLTNSFALAAAFLAIFPIVSKSLMPSPM